MFKQVNAGTEVAGGQDSDQPAAWNVATGYLVAVS